MNSAPATAKRASSIADSAVTMAYARAVLKARESLLDFTCLNMPDPEDPNDVSRSRYKPAKHHRALAVALEEVEKGNILRLIVTMPPRHGKTKLSTHSFPPYFLGRDPYRQIICATYNEDFALDHGRAVRETMRSTVFSQVFKHCKLKTGSQSAERLETTEGGAAFFVGRGGTLTGRGADLLLIDDPLKGREEADSPAIRNKLWKWFQDDAMTRLLSEGGRVIIIQTRWHEDDLVGRLTDPKNPHFVAEEAEKWHVVDLPAIAMDNDALGRKKGEPLWPERFGLTYLQGIKRLNARGFSALYQGRPTPEEGSFFLRKNLVTYSNIGQLPRELRMYAASDHAVSIQQHNDKTCLGCAGVDADGVLWILPDLDWGRFETDQTVELMLAQMQRHRPLTWWAENEHISKSIGPFLRKRMLEEQTYINVEPSSAAKDAQTRAQSFKGRVAMGMVRFPSFASWWTDAEEELLKFPNGSHDDFVSWCAHLGRGVDRMVSAKPRQLNGPKVAAVGTIGWVKAAHLAETKQRERERNSQGW